LCGAVRELATDGSSLNPGLVRPLSICIAAAAACLVVTSARADGAGCGDPDKF
jgi:hypothetical protein